jgi:hypothetical protein
MTVYPEVFRLWKRKDYSRVGEIVMHEMCHILFAPVQELYEGDVRESQRRYYRETLERQVERTTQTVVELLPDGWANPSVVRKYVKEL